MSIEYERFFTTKYSQKNNFNIFKTLVNKIFFRIYKIYVNLPLIAITYGTK